jgi:hypothetical protein
MFIVAFFNKCESSHHMFCPSFKKVAAQELQAKISRAETEARARLAPGAHAEDESGAIVEDYVPQYIQLFGEFFDWKENLSRSAVDTANRQERRTIEGDALGRMGTLGPGQPPLQMATTRPLAGSTIASRALTAQENDNGTAVRLLSTSATTTTSDATASTTSARSSGQTNSRRRRTSGSSLAHLQGDFNLEQFNEQSSEMFSSLGNLVTRLLGGTNEMQQDDIGTILDNMVRAENHAQSDSPAIASAGSAWLSRLTMQLNTQYGIQADAASTSYEANPH